MRDHSEAPPEGRKTYVRPEILKVPLQPGESVLGNCKTASVSGPVQSDCVTPTNCETDGS